MTLDVHPMLVATLLVAWVLVRVYGRVNWELVRLPGREYLDA